MYKTSELKEILEFIDNSSIQQFEFEHEALKIVIIKKKSSSSITLIEQNEKINEGKADQVIVDSVENNIKLPLKKFTRKMEEFDMNNNQSTLHKILSPMVGTFYSSTEPNADPLVKVGDKVKSDTVVCIIEVMKLFNDIEAQVSGEIMEILVQDGDLVEYGKPLFLVKTNKEK